MNTVRVYFRVEGRVQGVGYRYFALRQASAYRLGGWVRNCRDGSVEGVVEGPAEKVDVFLQNCRSGPPLANVRKMVIRNEKNQGEKEFVVKEDG